MTNQERYSFEDNLDTQAAELEVKIKRGFFICGLLVIPTILVTLFGYFGVLKPINEDIAIWFQRSGSLIVMCAVLIEFQLFSIHGAIFPSDVSFSQFTDLENKYGNKHKLFSVFAASVAILGTVIWGYGDLFR